MEIKPIKLGAVQPIKLGAVQPVQAKEQQAPQVAATPSSDEMMADLFGTQSVEQSKEEERTALEASKEERQAELKDAVNKSKGKSKKKGESSTEKKESKPAKKKYEGPREVKVYGMTLWTEENPDVTLEEIRQRIVTEYHYPEFSQGRTEMTFDDETGIIVPVIKFEKKG